MPFGMIRAESQRDSAPKPRVASCELPWEKRVVSANPNGVASWWRTGDTTPLGLKIARTLTQGSLADSATLGWRTQSLWDCRTSGLSGVPYGNGRAGNIRKAWAEILAALDWLHCTLRAFRYSKAPQPSPPREERGKQRASFGRWLCELERRINPAFRWWCQDAPMCAGGVQFNCRTSSPDLINTPLQRGVVRVRWLETVSTVSWLAWSERAIE